VLCVVSAMKMEVRQTFAVSSKYHAPLVPMYSSDFPLSQSLSQSLPQSLPSPQVNVSAPKDGVVAAVATPAVGYRVVEGALLVTLK
jgi:hypothetical protein